MHSRTIMAAAVVATVAAAMAGCSRGAAPAGGPGSQGSQGMASPPTPVQLATAKLAPIEDATEYVATIKSLHSTCVQSQTHGQLTDILVASGDRVAQGARLFQI